MSKQSKVFIFDQAARHARIRKENEEMLQSALKLFQQYNKIENNELIATIVDSLVTIEFFKSNCPEGMKLSDFVQYAIKFFNYECYSQGQAIFHYGEYGDKMYIILKGEVGVFGPRPIDDVNRDLEKQLEEDVLIVKGQKRSQVLLNETLLKMQDERYHQDGVLLYQKIFQFYAGQCFGDVALTSDKPRSASIIASSEKVHCITMRRNDFKIIFQKSIQEARNTIDYFMRIFPGTLKFNLSKFIQYLRPIVFQSKTILWQMGDEPSFFFIIVTGRVELFKYVGKDALIGKKQQDDRLFIGKQEHKSKIILSQLAEGNIVGQEELLEDLPTRQYYCEVADITHAYYMEASDFKAVQGNHPDIVDCLRERAKINRDYINKRKSLIIENMKNYEGYLNSLNTNKSNKSNLFKSNIRGKSLSNCVRSQKQLANSQSEIIQQNIAFAQKKHPQEEGELKFIVNNDNLSAIKERILRLQNTDSESPTNKHIKNKVIISQILKKYHTKKFTHEKRDMKRRSIFVTSSQNSITMPTENSVEIARRKQSQISGSQRLRLKKMFGERNSINTSVVNLTETETRTHHQTNITHITPYTHKFFKTIRSISGK